MPLGWWMCGVDKDSDHDKNSPWDSVFPFFFVLLLLSPLLFTTATSLPSFFPPTRHFNKQKKMSDQVQKQEPYVQPFFETARLTLDNPSADDDVAMGAMLSDLDTMTHLRFMTKEAQGGWKPADLTARRETQCKAIAEKRGTTYYIHDKKTGELAGVCGANTINVLDRNAVVGIILWKKYWSGGYGTEALYEMMRILFEDWNMHKV